MAKDLVKAKFPTAYVNDDGEWIYIQTTKTVTENCPECHQKWTHEKEDLFWSLGSGGTEEIAWVNAASRFGLL
jgi:hypothetical protein